MNETALVYTTAEVIALVRRALIPLRDRCGDLARGLGGAVEVQIDKAHYVGQAQGVSDAIHALEHALGAPSRTGPVRPELADVPPAEWPLVGAHRAAR